MTHSFTFTCTACEHEHPDCKFWPPRPAPVCSNPSSPAYSDPGDSGDVEGPDKCEKCGAEFGEWELYDAGLASWERACDDAEEDMASDDGGCDL